MDLLDWLVYLLVRFPIAVDNYINNLMRLIVMYAANTVLGFLGRGLASYCFDASEWHGNSLFEVTPWDC